MDLMKSPLQQESHPYKLSTIEYNSINTGTSETIIRSKSTLQMWSTRKDKKAG